MTYHDSTRLLQGFTKNRILIEQALDRVPSHDEEADHCLNKLFADAADYMMSAGNPTKRRRPSRGFTNRCTAFSTTSMLWRYSWRESGMA